MAVVAPFRALRYDPQKIDDLGKVVTPPYDVINPQQQQGYYDSHPKSVIRLELNRKRDSDDSRDNRYTRAAGHLQNWLGEGVMRRDPKPAFYVSETTYTDVDGNQATRRGFFTLLKVEDFSTGVVLPHEKTFTGHREDRLKLTKATSCNMSPIFALYPDEDNEVQEVLNAARTAPEADFVDPQGLLQKLWRVDDEAACRRVQELMSEKVIFIADGHHRYETALSYRDYMRDRHPERGEMASFNFVLVYLCSMGDPGLTVFPCHRLLPHLEGFDARDFLALAQPWFEVQEVAPAGSEDEHRARLNQTLQEAGQRGRCFALACADNESFYVLSLKDGAVDDPQWRQLAGPLRSLDVEMLTSLVLERILGLDNYARDQIHTIKYLSTMDEVLGEVRSGQAKVGFLINPTRVDQVKAVAEAGLIMPRKATYFYPKVLTGLVINLIDPAEDAPGCQG